MDELHPPKVELFDVAAGTNTDPKGIVRAVETYRLEPYGLYLARAVPDHPTVLALRSWLLPGAGLRVTDYTFRPGREPDWDRYLDVVAIDAGADPATGPAADPATGPAGPSWRTTDLYLDLVVRTGASVRVLDSDEFVAAVRAGLLDAATAERALTATYAAVEGITVHGYSVDSWLDLSWPTAR